MRLATTTEYDLPEIIDWLNSDPFHKDDDNDPTFLMTWNCLKPPLGLGVIAFKVVDDIGTICFMRVDRDGELGRISTQFGPESEVSKRRVIVGLSKLGIPMCIEAAQEAGLRGVVYESTNPTLIAYCHKKFSFEPLVKDDYVLKFEVKECAA
jgi:hypothetical protein